ncbi:MAG: hypothetical protein V2A77_07450 [Pseudomonadota bacterium]
MADLVMVLTAIFITIMATAYIFSLAFRQPLKDVLREWFWFPPKAEWATASGTMVVVAARVSKTNTSEGHHPPPQM